jgi:hypothetical protein
MQRLASLIEAPGQDGPDIRPTACINLRAAHAEHPAYPTGIRCSMAVRAGFTSEIRPLFGGGPRILPRRCLRRALGGDLADQHMTV